MEMAMEDLQQQQRQQKQKKTKKKRKAAGSEARELQRWKSDTEEAARLQSLLFGCLQDPLTHHFGKEIDTFPSPKQDHSLGIDDGYFEDRKGDLVGGDDSPGELDNEPSLQRTPAWQDEDEQAAHVDVSKVNRLRKLRKEETEKFVSGSDYILRLREQHSKLNPRTSWAELPSKDSRGKELYFDSDSEAEGENSRGLDPQSVQDSEGYSILRRNEDLVLKSTSRLPQGFIEITKMRDANFDEPSNAVVQSVQFHRNAQLLMTAGFDKKLRFFQIDGKRNPKIQSIYVEDFPIHKASFVPDGSKVVASGRRNFYITYDMEHGKVDRMSPLIGRDEKSLESFEVCSDSRIIAFMGNEGYILLASLSTKQLVGTLKMNGSVRAMSFVNDGKELLSIGGDGEIYSWDLRMRRCIHKGKDEGCINATALTASSDGRLMSTGSDTGVVNIYNREEFLRGVSKPAKTLMNLTTTVDIIKFNVDTQLMAICSRMKKNNLRLVHLPSYTVFHNWPTVKTPLQYVHSFDFSPGGGYLAAGNAAGKVLLYRLNYYDHA
ncbi:hypothetical protein O6H91_18G038900 [Diphasiastrum complanatum]|nr:hypothetical protein O6H91_18G038900 [Diphasiastrum complanatum]